MIFGVGVDIVEIRRIKKAMGNNDKFINRIFSEEEVDYLRKKKFRPEFAAGKFAAKEAVVKAMGTGFSGFDIKDVVIVHEKSGKPQVVLRGKANVFMDKFGKYKIHLSISHSDDNAIAYAVMEVEE